MHNTFKVAISLPKEDYQKVEKIRKELGVGRSTVIDKAIRFWLRHREQEDLIKRYQDGYRKKLEHVRETEAMEKMAAEAFREENLQ